MFRVSPAYIRRQRLAGMERAHVRWRIGMLTIGYSVFAVCGIKRGPRTRDTWTRLHTYYETEGRAGDDACGSEGCGRRQKFRHVPCYWRREEVHPPAGANCSCVYPRRPHGGIVAAARKGPGSGQERRVPDRENTAFLWPVSAPQAAKTRLPPRP